MVYEYGILAPGFGFVISVAFRLLVLHSICHLFSGVCFLFFLLCFYTYRFFHVLLTFLDDFFCSCHRRWCIYPSHLITLLSNSSNPLPGPGYTVRKLCFKVN